MGSVLRYDPRRRAKITCRECIGEMGSLLEASLPAARRRRVENHRSECRDCRRYLTEYRDAIQLAKAAYAATDEEALPESMVRNVLASIRATT